MVTKPPDNKPRQLKGNHSAGWRARRALSEGLPLSLGMNSFRRFIASHRTHAFVCVYGYGVLAMLNSAITGAPFLGVLCNIFFPMIALMSAAGVLLAASLLLIAVLEGDWPRARRALINAAWAAASYIAFALATGWADHITV